MGSPESYRGEVVAPDGLPPRKLVWKSRWDGPGGVTAWAFMAWVFCFALLVTGGVLVSVVGVKAFGETRDAEIVSVDLRVTSKGTEYYAVGFRHTVDGRSREGVRDVYRDAQGAWPPGIPVAPGEAASVSCLSVLGYHGDDLALPRESAFHRRAGEIVEAALFSLFAWMFVAFGWFQSLRPAHRERALFRDGVIAVGRVTGLEIIRRGWNKTPIRRVRYTFQSLNGPARSGTCDACDDAAHGRLAIGDVVNVVYDADDWRHSQVYEVGAYRFVPPSGLLASTRT